MNTRRKKPEHHSFTASTILSRQTSTISKRPQADKTCWLHTFAPNNRRMHSNATSNAKPPTRDSVGLFRIHATQIPSCMTHNSSQIQANVIAIPDVNCTAPTPIARNQCVLCRAGHKVVCCTLGRASPLYPQHDPSWRRFHSARPARQRWRRRRRRCCQYS